MRVLVVEDEVNVAAVIRRGPAFEGHRADRAGGRGGAGSDRPRPVAIESAPA